MEMKIQDYLKQALHEENEFLRLQMFSKSCKMITQQLPFQTKLEILQKQKDLLRCLLIGSAIFQQSIDLIMNIIIEKISRRPNLITYYFQTASSVAQLDENQLDQEPVQYDAYVNPHTTKNNSYCREVVKNIHKIKGQLLTYAKELTGHILRMHKEKRDVGESVHSFYKYFIENNHKFEMLNRCFKDIIELREKWPHLQQWDPYFEQEIESILISKSINGKNENDDIAEVVDEDDKKKLLDLVSSRMNKNNNAVDTQEEKQQSNQSKQERIITSLERWLYKSTQPLISLSEFEDTITAEFFKVQNNVDTIISFMFHPLKCPIYKRPSVQLPEAELDMNSDSIPHFKRQWQDYEEAFYKNQEERLILQYRGYKTMVALTHTKNHFLITQANGEFFQVLFQTIYDLLRQSSSVFILTEKVAVKYLTFLLFYEPDITVYMLLSYNIPYRILLHAEFPIMAQLLLQLMMTQYGSKEFRLDYRVNTMVWRYLENTDFFRDVQQLCLGDENNSAVENILHQKIHISYKPKNLIQEMKKPDMTPHQQEKQSHHHELKKIPEDYDITVGDLDLMRPLMTRKGIRTKSLLEFMLDSSPTMRKKLKRGTLNNIDFEPSETESPLSYVKNSPEKQLNLFQIVDACIKEELPLKANEIAASPNPSSRPSIVINARKQSMFTIRAEKKFKINSQQRLSVETVNSIKPEESSTNIVKRPRQSIVSITPIINRNMILSAKQSNANSQFVSPRGGSLHLETLAQPPTNLLRRFQNLLVDQRPRTTHSNSRRLNGLSDYSIKQRESNLYPSNLKDCYLTPLEEKSKLPIYDTEYLERNEPFTSSLMNMVHTLIEELFTWREKGRQELEIRRMKWRVISGGKDSEFLDWLAQNYFLKLKVWDDDELCTPQLAGKIYNKILSNVKNVVLNMKLIDIESTMIQHFKLLIQLMTSIYILEPFEDMPLQLQNSQIINKLKAQTYLLFESFTLMIEVTTQPAKLVNTVSTSIWHMLLLKLQEHKTNDLYIQLFDRVIQLAILHGNAVFFHNMILRLNCFQYFLQIQNEFQITLQRGLWSEYLPVIIRKMFLLIYSILRIKSGELFILRSQVEILASFKTLRNIYLREMTMIERDDYSEVKKMVSTDNQIILAKLIQSSEPSRFKKK